MAAAREARYGLLAEISAEISANVIVTAHTIDDQRETLAMRTARLNEGEAGAGTGISEAMLFDRRIWIARPFLACRRADIRAYLNGRGMSWLNDPSNEDVRYERIRTRKACCRNRRCSLHRTQRLRARRCRPTLRRGWGTCCGSRGRPLRHRPQSALGR